CKPVRASRPPWRSSRPSFGGGFSLPNAQTSAPGGKAADDRRICSAPPKPLIQPRHNRQDSNEPEPAPAPEDGSGPDGGGNFGRTIRRLNKRGGTISTSNVSSWPIRSNSSGSAFTSSGTISTVSS